MKPHFSILISSNSRMEFMTKTLLNSIETFGNCKNYFCTIITDEKRYLSKNFFDFIQKRGEIIEYVSDSNKFLVPWINCPRWNVPVIGDFFIAFDADVIVLKDLNNLFLDCNMQKLSGVIADKSPFKQKSYSIWKKLYNVVGVSLPENLYTYACHDEEIFCNKEKSICPPYFNHGLLVLPTNLLLEMQHAVKFVVSKIKNIIGENYYFPQIVTTLAASVARIECNMLHKKYNTLSDVDENTVVYHYCCSRDKIFDVKDFIKIHSKLIQFKKFNIKLL